MSEKRVEELTNLLREARESVFRDSLCREYDDTHKTEAMEEHKKRTRLKDRIDAALKEHETKEPVVVDWAAVYWDTYAASIDGAQVCIRKMDDKWCWDVMRSGDDCATLEEGKSAATKAARGMR